jgi:hypothetical protein
MKGKGKKKKAAEEEEDEENDSGLGGTYAEIGRLLSF